MALLDDAIDACGGLARWNSLSRFTLHLSVGGTLFADAGHAREFKDVTAEGSMRTQSVRFTGITGGEQSGAFAPDAITIETLDGQMLRTLSNPSLAVPSNGTHALADELHLVFFCGVQIWNYLTTPFLLARPDVAIEELPPWRENNETWRRLRAQLPPSLINLASEQVFYFDENALQRRTDHDLLGARVAHYSWAHDNFDGIVVPTLRRTLMQQPDGSAIAKPVLIDVEIFDAVFE
ncbi:MULTISPECIES: hypothetical protein [unclassified Bradyrhizobium]|uniref:hypothetical protein n=1 Tax=unclassified Bradyrhizobium TaxID=2631580 RepID=UPI00230514CB|nr:MULTISPECIES: hypothetical protein [unclassified Bradyrhizobium]MDA9411133.1 hypothetical protein [Bradyrhizobium sp. CCBAU 45384]MDA9442682.1 hypothetical protein [Bradyrhizobium sp. CCBAU 51745]